MRDIDFFVRDRNAKEQLQLKEESRIYPPRFRVEICCFPFARPDQIKIEFRGAVTDLLFDIILTTASGTRGVSTSSSTSDKEGLAVSGLKSNIFEHMIEHILNVIFFSSLASIASGCSSIHEQDGPTPLGIMLRI